MDTAPPSGRPCPTSAGRWDGQAIEAISPTPTTPDQPAALLGPALRDFLRKEIDTVRRDRGAGLLEIQNEVRSLSRKSERGALS